MTAFLPIWHSTVLLPLHICMLLNCLETSPEHNFYPFWYTFTPYRYPIPFSTNHYSPPHTHPQHTHFSRSPSKPLLSPLQTSTFSCAFQSFHLFTIKHLIIKQRLIDLNLKQQLQLADITYCVPATNFRRSCPLGKTTGVAMPDERLTG